LHISCAACTRPDTGRKTGQPFPLDLLPTLEGIAVRGVRRARLIPGAAAFPPTLSKEKKMDMATSSSTLQNEFVISHVCNAPRLEVWKAWTERERLMQWYGPQGYTTPYAELDLRPGGVFHYAMHGPDGGEIWGKWTFSEIDTPERLVLINSFSDAQGGITRHPMSPNWPLETLSTTTFESLGNKTRLTIHWSPWLATELERTAFAEAYSGMEQGWNGTFAQLDTYLQKQSTNAAERELIITRAFDAPQWLVWQAWTEPERLMQWACPNECTLLSCDGELHVGGTWHSEMRSHDGRKLVVRGTYREIAPCEGLMFTHAWTEGMPPGPETIVTVHLSEHQGRTTMIFRQTGFDSAQSRDGHEGGWGQAFDRLGQYLQQAIAATPHQLTLSRVFDAPRKLMFRTWTDPELVARWWGPHGFTAPLCKLDARPGGKILINMRGPKGSPYDMDMPMKGEFVEVIAPERLVFTSSAMEDSAGNAQLEVHNTVTFERYQDKTSITVRAIVIHSTAAVAGAIAGMEQGWTQSLEKLSALVEENA
jgi:uncharacterized protein YndB with AHSA1/START domain